MRALALLAALLTAAPARADSVRFSWMPATETDVALYLVERSAGSAEWCEVARVQAGPEAPEFDALRGVFTFAATVDGAPGRWRLTAVDRLGNVGRPVYLVPEEPAAAPNVCTWHPSPAPWPAELAVAVDCGDKPCACAEVSRRLDSARLDVWGAVGSAEGRMLDHVLARARIYIVGPELLVTPDGQQAAGYASAKDGVVLLARDLHAAAHELLHLYLDEVGVAAEAQHARMAEDRLMRAIDERNGTAGWRR